MTNHKTGAREEWLAARLELLKAEKELTRRGDELAQRRQSEGRTVIGQCRIIGHGLEDNGVFYCCAHCATVAGVAGLRDRAETRVS